MKTLIGALVIFLCSFAAQAEPIHLYEWSPGETISPLIIPVRASETPEVAAQRYLNALSKSSDLVELFDGRMPTLQLQGFKRIDDSQREQRALLIANLPKDLTRNSLRITNFKKIFSKSNHRSFILPMNANLGLTMNETSDFFKQISEKFPFLVAIGGEDVEPSLYKKENFHAKSTNPTRDKFEIELIRYYTAREKGFLLGVCRGSQISSVALGYKLIQDVPFHVGDKVGHSDTWHDIEVYDTSSNLLKSMADSQGKIHVNSLHHQSVIFKEGGPLQIAARSSDGVTEATEFKNGRGLLLQFHPELMDNEMGSKMLWKIVQQKNKVMVRSCGSIFAL